MPLRRAVFQDAVDFSNPARIRFPLTEHGATVIWGEITDAELRRRAITHGLPGLNRRALFDRYRLLLEVFASEAFDDGRTAASSDGATVVAVDFPD